MKAALAWMASAIRIRRWAVLGLSQEEFECDYPKVIDGLSLCPVNTFDSFEEIAIADIVAYTNSSSARTLRGRHAPGRPRSPLHVAPSAAAAGYWGS
jgi:hypothetical protein